MFARILVFVLNAANLSSKRYIYRGVARSASDENRCLDDRTQVAERLAPLNLAAFVSVLISLASTCAFAATVRTNVWITLDKGGFWSDAANWENGEKPATDGSSYVIISNELAAASVSFTVYVDENVNVRGIRYLQGKMANTAPQLYVLGGYAIKIGADGIFGQNWGTYNAYDSTHGRQMNVASNPGGLVELMGTQVWQDRINGIGHADWISPIGANIKGAADVNWSLTGIKHTFSSDRSGDFRGTLYPQRSVCFSGADQFGRFPKIVLCSTNCFGSAFTTSEPRLSYLHLKSGTGSVDSEIRFDTNHSGSPLPHFMSTQNTPTNENTTVFRGKWSGAMAKQSNQSYCGLTFVGNGYQYSNGHVFNTGFDGMFRPSTMQWWFENDMAGLDVPDGGGKNIQFPDVIFVLKHPTAFKNLNFFINKGRCGRLKGILSAGGQSFGRMVTCYEWAYPVGATMLVGVGDASYSEWTGRLQIGRDANLGEKPVWLYAPDGGTVRFKSSFVYSGPFPGHVLPYQIWGGGTVIMSADQSSFSTKNTNAPFYVRDGRLVVGGSGSTYGVNVSPIRVGVQPPSTVAVRALEMEVISATYSSDFQTLTFAKERKPDGVTLKGGDKVLVNIPTDGTAPKYNGVYTVQPDTKVWKRLSELNTPAKCVPDIRVTVAEGKTFGGTSWFLHNESRRWCDIHGKPQTLTFDNADYCVAFLQQPHNDPDVALLLENGRTLANTVDVVDNLSAGTTTLGAYDTDLNSRFTGSMTITKPSVVLTAPSGSTCSFEGKMSGTTGIVKTGAGTVVVKPSDAKLTITDVAVSAGTLNVPSARLKAGLRSAQFPFTGGATAVLALSGNVNLDEWTFTVTGLDRPPDRLNPPDFDFDVISSDGGTVTGTPQIVLTGPDTYGWRVTRRKGFWKVRYCKIGFIFTMDSKPQS